MKDKKDRKSKTLATVDGDKRSTISVTPYEYERFRCVATTGRRDAILDYREKGSAHKRVHMEATGMRWNGKDYE